MKHKRKLVAFLIIAVMTIATLSTNVFAASISLSGVSVGIGGSASISYSVSSGYNGSIRWSSSNTSIVEVSGNRVYGKAYGSATITATLDDGSTGTCTVSVTDAYGSRYQGYNYSRSRVRMHTTYKTLSVGSSFSLDFSVDNYYDSSSGYVTGNYTGGYTYSSSNPSVAEVSGGTVTAKKPGVATITVSLNNGYGSGSCTVVVKGWSDDGYYYDDDYYRNYYLDSDYYDDYYDRYGYYPDDYYYYYNDYYRGRLNRSSSSSSSSSRASTATTEGTVKLTEKASRDAVISRVSEANGNSAILQNYASVSAESLQDAANLSSSPICFDTMSGRTVAGRLTFRPADAGKFSGDILTGVYCNTGNTRSVVNRFNKAFSNRTQVVLIDQPSFSAPVEISIKANNLETGNLNYYTYNPTSNIYTPITVTNQFKDANGFLHFTTTHGGYIIISEGALYAV